MNVILLFEKSIETFPIAVTGKKLLVFKFRLSFAKILTRAKINFD